MNHLGNMQGGGELDTRRTSTLNSMEAAKGIEVINNFVQVINNSQNGDEILEWLLRDPAALPKFLNNYSDMQKKCQELEQRLSQAAITIGTKDTGFTASSGHECYESVRQYQALKDDFNAVSAQIFDISQQPTSSFNRNKMIAKIQGHLSTMILINNYFLMNNALKNTEFNLLTRQIVNLIISYSKIAELKYRYPVEFPSPEDHDILEQLAKNKLQQSLIDGLAVLTKSSDRERNCTEIIRLIEAWASKHLCLNIRDHKHVRESISNLVYRGIDFVMNLSNAIPPGRLWIEEKGVQFEQDRHQLHQICNESQTEFTIFPGYSINSVILQKAVVFTNSPDS